MKKEKYAKEVYSFDLGVMIDRTEQPHPKGKFDTDFKVPSATNPDARQWTYAGTKRTLKEAIDFIPTLRENYPAMQTRIVDAETGKILYEYPHKKISKPKIPKPTKVKKPKQSSLVLKGKKQYVQRMYKHLRKEHPSTKRKMSCLECGKLSKKRVR